MPAEGIEDKLPPQAQPQATPRAHNGEYLKPSGMEDGREDFDGLRLSANRLWDGEPSKTLSFSPSGWLNPQSIIHYDVQ